MSIQNLSQADILGYRKDIISILEKQIDILQEAEKRILPKKADLEDDKAKESVLTIEKSGELQQILNNEITKLQKFDVVLAVVGTMKAGKSTTINAIVGREILPNRNRPMTALPTLICHNPDKQTPSISIDSTILNNFLTKLRDKLHLASKLDVDIGNVDEEDGNDANKRMRDLIDFIAKGGQFENYYECEENIFNFLYQLNDLVRLSKAIRHAQIEQGEQETLCFPFDDYKNFANLPMIEVAFKIDGDFDTQGRFMLLDTAGPNEAGYIELKKALTEQLERSSAVMVILDYTQLNSEAEKEVKEQIVKIRPATVQKSRLFALVNKFDQKNANSDSATVTCKYIFNNLLKDAVELDNIYAISAQDAYLANRMKSYIEFNNDKPEYQPKTWVEDFAKKLFGEMAETIYPTANVDMIQQGLNKIIERSRMAEPIQNVIINMQMNAPFIAIQSALAGAGDVFDDLHNVLNIKKAFLEKVQLTDQEIEGFQHKIDDIKEKSQSLESKKQELESSIKLMQKKIHDKNKIEDKIKEINSKTENVIREEFQKINQKAKEELRSMEEKRGGIMKWMTVFKTEEDIVNEQTKIAELKNNISKDENAIKFSQIDDFHQFKSEISKHINNLINDHIIITFETILQDGLESVQKIMSAINKDANDLSILLKEEFKKDNLELRIECNLMANLDKEIAKIDRIELEPKMEEFNEIVNDNSLFGFLKRGIGRMSGNEKLGKYHIKQNISIIHKDKFINHIEDMINNQCVKPLKEQVDEKIKNLLFKNMYDIGCFSKKVDEIIHEIQHNLNEQKQTIIKSKSEKEEEKKAIIELKIRHDDLDKDWQKLKEVFKVEDIKS